MILSEETGFLIIYFTSFTLFVNILIQSDWLVYKMLPRGVKINESFFNKIRIKQWKDKLPSVSGFDKTQIKEFKELKYLERYVYEVRKGCVIHTLYFFAVIPAFFLANITPQYFVLFFIFVFVSNTPFYLITLYNTARMEQIVTMLQRQAARVKNE